MDTPKPAELTVSTLGEARVPSPLVGRRSRFVDDDRGVFVYSTTEEAPDGPALWFQAAGPRRDIFHDPSSVVCGIVTCGGLCPGLNDVIRSIVLTATHSYGVGKILGFRYGYSGLSSNAPTPPYELTPAMVENIHEQGGTILASSRGPQNVGDMVDHLVRLNVGILFVIGGDGTLKGASAIRTEISRRGLAIGVVGIPKTIDNDLVWVQRTFGFTTATEAAGHAILCAHAEARGAWNGVGLVKLMGRHAGFVAAHATLARADVNFCLVPEVPFTLHGNGGFLEALEARLEAKHHAVVVAAEGAGQDILADPEGGGRDASGNVKLEDVGLFLRDKIRSHFKAKSLPVDVKYIDPSYMIRSLPARALDSEFCLLLGQHAVHAGMAGKTDLMIGYWNGHFTHVPLSLVTGRKRRLIVDGEVWPQVLEATGQSANLLGTPSSG
jgi:6-phosphofructokinase 1